MDAPLTRLEQAREELARRWLVRVVESASLAEISRLDTGRIARELPELISDLVRATHLPGDVPGESGAPQRSAGRLASLRGGAAPDPAVLARDLAALQSVLLEALAGDLAEREARATLEAVERVARVLGEVLVAGVSDLFSARSRELESLASTDALTGLYNVRHMRRQVDQLIGVQRRYGHPFAVVVLDIDGLKRINDASGHAAGDEALTGVAAAVRGTIRSIDTAVRMGGDEFCVLAPNQTSSGARVLGERLSRAVDRLGGPGGAPLGISVGVVSCPEHAVEAERLFELADEAMYQAKASGTRVAVAAVEAAGEGASHGRR